MPIGAATRADQLLDIIEVVESPASVRKPLDGDLPEELRYVNLEHLNRRAQFRTN
jgi:hypothetical protein